jgi:hypothetical protein
MDGAKFSYYRFDGTPTRCAGLLRMISMLMLHSKNENVQLDAADILDNDFSYLELKNRHFNAGVILPYVHVIIRKSSKLSFRKKILDQLLPAFHDDSFFLDLGITEFAVFDVLIKYINSDPEDPFVTSIIEFLSRFSWPHDIGKTGGVSQVYLPRLWEMMHKTNDGDDFWRYFKSIFSVSLNLANSKKFTKKSCEIFISLLKDASEIRKFKTTPLAIDFLYTFHLKDILWCMIEADDLYDNEYFWENHVLKMLDSDREYQHYALMNVDTIARHIKGRAESFLNSGIIRKLCEKTHQDCDFCHVKHSTPCMETIFWVFTEISKNDHFPQNKGSILLETGIIKCAFQYVMPDSELYCSRSFLFRSLAYLERSDNVFGEKLEKFCEEIGFEKMFEDYKNSDYYLSLEKMKISKS